MARKRIGMVSGWSTGRGLANVTLNFVKMLQGEHDCFLLKLGDNPISKDFDVDINIKEITSLSEKEYVDWLVENKIDAVIFNEFGQWRQEPIDLPLLAKQAGVKVWGFFVMERFKEEQTKHFDRILVPNTSLQKFMRYNKIRNFTLIPYSIDLKEFEDVTILQKDKSFVFLHIAGMGGVDDRKNTDVVIEAFKMFKEEDNVKLIITSQKPLPQWKHIPNVEIIDKHLDREELLSQYTRADFTLLPSKWETIGIPCVIKDTPIYTNNGIRMIQNINKGDKVLTHKGNYKKVLDIGNKKSKEIYKLSTKYNNNIYITGNHPVYAIKTTNQKIYGEYSKFCKKKNLKWVPVEQIEKNDFVAIRKSKKTNNISHIKISDYIDMINIKRDENCIYNKHGYNMKNIKNSGMKLVKKYNIPKSILYRCLNNKKTRIPDNIVKKIKKEYDNFIHKIPDKIKIDKDFCKLIGYYIAEGWRSGSNFGFASHAKEHEYRKFVMKTIKRIFNITGVEKIDGNKGCINFSNKIVGEFFESLCGHLAHNKHVPEILLHIAPELQKEIIIGHYWGDDTKDRDNRKIELSTVSKCLAYDLRHLFLRCGILSSISTDKREKYRDCYRIRAALNKKLIKMFGLEKDPPRYDIYFEDDDFFYVKVKEIKKTSKKRTVYNMEVEDDNSYCGEIVYHNCLESLAMGVPVITTAVPPMNEYIVPGVNGYLCTPTMKRSPNVFIHAAYVDAVDLYTNMRTSMNDMILLTLKKNSKHIVKELYNLEKNKKYLLAFISENL